MKKTNKKISSAICSGVLLSAIAISGGLLAKDSVSASADASLNLSDSFKVATASARIKDTTYDEAIRYRLTMSSDDYGLLGDDFVTNVYLAPTAKLEGAALTATNAVIKGTLETTAWKAAGDLYEAYFFAYDIPPANYTTEISVAAEITANGASDLTATEKWSLAYVADYVLDHAADYDADDIAAWTTNLTAYATIAVDYDANGGSEVADTTVRYGDKLTAPVSTKLGYELVGWKNGAVAYDFDAEVKAPLTLTAEWSLEQYAIAYVLNGGDNHADNPETYTVNTVDKTLYTPTKAGYDFAGWTCDGVAISSLDGKTGDLTLTATWTARDVNYTVKYVTEAGGEAVRTETKTGKTDSTVAAIPAGAFVENNDVYVAEATTSNATINANGSTVVEVLCTLDFDGSVISGYSVALEGSDDVAYTKAAAGTAAWAYEATAGRTSSIEATFSDYVDTADLSMGLAAKDADGTMLVFQLAGWNDRIYIRLAGGDEVEDVAANASGTDAQKAAANLFTEINAGNAVTLKLDLVDGIFTLYHKTAADTYVKLITYLNTNTAFNFDYRDNYNLGFYMWNASAAGGKVTGVTLDSNPTLQGAYVTNMQTVTNNGDGSVSVQANNSVNAFDPKYVFSTEKGKEFSATATFDSTGLAGGYYGGFAITDGTTTILMRIVTFDNGRFLLKVNPFNRYTTSTGGDSGYYGSAGCVGVMATGTSYTLRISYENGLLSIYKQTDGDWKPCFMPVMVNAIANCSAFDVTKSVRVGVGFWHSDWDIGGCINNFAYEFGTTSSGNYLYNVTKTVDGDTVTYTVPKTEGNVEQHAMISEKASTSFSISATVTSTDTDTGCCLGFVIAQGGSRATILKSGWDTWKVYTALNASTSLKDLSTGGNTKLESGVAYAMSLTYADGTFTLVCGGNTHTFTVASFNSLLGTSFDASKGFYVGVASDVDTANQSNGTFTNVVYTDNTQA